VESFPHMKETVDVPHELLVSEPLSADWLPLQWAILGNPDGNSSVHEDERKQLTENIVYVSHAILMMHSSEASLFNHFHY